MKLRFALNLCDPAIPLDHWQRSIAANCGLENIYKRAEAEAVEALLKQVDPAIKGWQTAAWRLERAHDYQNRQAAVQVNVNTLVGVSDDVWRRARHYVPKRAAVEIEPPKNKLTGEVLTTGDAE